MAADRQDWAAAIPSYHAALAAEPDLPGMREALANAVQKTGKSNDAAEDISGKSISNQLDAPDARLAPTRELHG